MRRMGKVMRSKAHGDDDDDADDDNDDNDDDFKNLLRSESHSVMWIHR